MKASSKVAAWLFGAALLVGSCTLNNVGSDYAADSQAGSGVVVASLGRTGASEFDLMAVVRPVAGGRTYQIVVDNNKVTKDFGKVIVPPPGSPYSDWGYVPETAPLERLVVTSLPAGDYEFSSVSGIAPRFSGSSPDPFSISSDPIGLRFTVRPGSVTYLGSVVFGFPGWLSTSHAFGPMKVVTADTHDRDAELVRSRYPKLGPNLPDRELTGAGASREVKYYLRVESDGGSAKD